MILEMKVPSPGESITEVEIAEWLVQDGDYVEKDQAIAEVDSDKATLELPAEASGIIKLEDAEGNRYEEGDAVVVGAVVCLIDTSAAKPEGSDEPKEEKKEAPKKEAPKAAEAPKKEEVKAEAPAAAPVAKAAPAKADDLTKVEGIGPKAAEALVNAGFITFADLAKAKPTAISEIIAGVRGNHVTDTWPAQAKLAADGKWDELKKWQDELDGGKA